LSNYKVQQTARHYIISEMIFPCS